MSQPNRLMIALTAIFAGAATGGAVANCFVWAAWQGMGGTPAFQFLTLIGDFSNTVFVGWGLGAVIAFVITWRLSTQIVETWRRAAMGVTAGLGTVGAGGGGQGIGMASMMSMSPLTTYWLPAYILLFVVIAVLAFRFNAKYRNAVPAA
jgi:hypothetical protein